MKTKALSLTLVALLTTASLLASHATNEENKIQMTRSTEYVVSDKITERNNTKIVIEENENKQVLSRTIYRWDDEAWIPCKRYDYTYQSDNATIPSSMNYMKWNRVQGDWGHEEHFHF